MIFHLLLAALSFIATITMSTPAPQVSEAIPQQNEQVRANSGMLVTTEWLAQHLHDPDLVVLCIASSPGYCDEAHIPGARTILLSDISVARDDIPNELAPIGQLQQVFSAAAVTDRSRIVLYGERYGVLAARAYFTLDYLGLARHTALLNGGIEQWRAERRPQSGTATVIGPAKTQIHLNESVRVSTPEMRQILHSGRPIALLDARPQEEYSGVRLSADLSKSGHIPGAKSLYWMDLLVSREHPVLRPDNELRQLFLDAGAPSGKTVITYCRSGMQSSFDYFVAKYLGYDARMYDASFFEWTWDDLPAERSPK